MGAQHGFSRTLEPKPGPIGVQEHFWGAQEKHLWGLRWAWRWEEQPPQHPRAESQAERTWTPRVSTAATWAEDPAELLDDLEAPGCWAGTHGWLRGMFLPRNSI